MKPDPDRQVLIDQSIARYRKLLEEQLPGDDATLDQIEQAIEKIGKGILPDLQEKVTNNRSKKARDNKIKCSCGGWARYRRITTKTLVTIHGLLEWQRPTYHCSSCGKGCAPLDVSLGLDKADTTLAVRDLVAFLAADAGFVDTAQTLRKLAASICLHRPLSGLRYWWEANCDRLRWQTLPCTNRINCPINGQLVHADYT